jgi:hypothetical protein
MRSLSISVLVCVLCLVPAFPALSDEAQDCETLVKKCLTLFQEQGKEPALKAINDPKGPFIKGDIYVFALDMENKVLAHPYDKALLRMTMSNVIDANGQRFFVKFKEVAEKSGSGWVGYTWAKPGQEGAKPKSTYITKVPGDELYIGAGYYLK